MKKTILHETYHDAMKQLGVAKLPSGNDMIRQPARLHLADVDVKAELRGKRQANRTENDYLHDLVFQTKDYDLFRQKADYLCRYAACRCLGLNYFARQVFLDGLLPRLAPDTRFAEATI